MYLNHGQHEEREQRNKKTKLTCTVFFLTEQIFVFVIYVGLKVMFG